MDKQQPVPGEFYRRDPDKLYQIITVAQDVDDGKCKIVYQTLSGEFPVYVEPLERFLRETNRVRPRKCRDVASRMEAIENLNIHDEGEQPIENDPDGSGEGTVNPRLLEFLDASTNQEKLDILQKIRREIDDKLMDDLAMSLDLTLSGKDVQQKYKELQNCLLTYIKYESARR